MRYIYKLGNIPPDVIRYCGGKALSLHIMIGELDLPVPPGYVMISDSFCGGDITLEALAELNGLISRLDPRKTYAVRSSALNEDGAKASFAGQYETVTNVKTEYIVKAVRSVISSAGNARVKGYTQSFDEDESGIAVVIQEFIDPDYAGVIFTSDPVTGEDDHMVGNFVSGEGEALVSGQKNAEVFRVGTVKYYYEGPDVFRRYARTLLRYSKIIRRGYKTPMDIEWAVKDGKVKLLQARPITTLRRADMTAFEINGSMSGHKLLTKTNVGEIFMKSLSPMTYSVLEMINDLLGMPEWLDNVCGQAYMNISVMCSMLVSFGMSEKKAFEAIRSLTGNIPEGTKVPVSPFDRRKMLKKVRTLVFPKNKVKMSRKEKHEMVSDLPAISDRVISEIKDIGSSKALLDYWNTSMVPNLNAALSSIMSESGTSLMKLFSIPNKITKIAGEEMSRKLCSGSLGVIASMRPLLMLEDVIEGKVTREEYIRSCGHRSVNEMELMEKRPYEDPSFPENLIEEHKRSGADVHAMLQKQHLEFEAALKEFKEKYPSKKDYIDKRLREFRHANDFREDIRSKGVLIFCVFREFCLKAGCLTGLGDDIFMLTYKELFALLGGDDTCLGYIGKRRKTFERYRSYPSFPGILIGRFDPEKWMSDPLRRMDFHIEGSSSKAPSDAAVKGFPGAAGTVTGVVRVITDPDDIDKIQKGEILVTVATNVGWTLAFPKVSAIVTDIGAPLSHAAIVAREFGIPAVVGCGNATMVLKTGDVITVDGGSGTIVLEGSPKR